MSKWHFPFFLYPQLIHFKTFLSEILWPLRYPLTMTERNSEIFLLFAITTIGVKNDPKSFFFHSLTDFFQAPPSISVKIASFCFPTNTRDSYKVTLKHQQKLTFVPNETKFFLYCVDLKICISRLLFHLYSSGGGLNFRWIGYFSSDNFSKFYLIFVFRKTLAWESSKNVNFAGWGKIRTCPAAIPDCIVPAGKEVTAVPLQRAHYEAAVSSEAKIKAGTAKYYNIK